ncbi:SDR family NAD(P)-dependent oxidoreductase [Pseudooceanicola aestuarii]|uniref:SDR family NAD(P)-dependent oxidoreductase n=1 Tax=Pseudooceanicola aestuarii TaxID=2697319 RepID=UPI0013D4731A|nr:SDR family NAD(P)-dependent oxidoreductase [Pseudooceanicola aestuarii]
MRDLKGKTYWIIGASDGLGEQIARQMQARGARLILSARSADRLATLADELDATALPLDVTDAAAVARAAQAGQLADGLVYSVGLYEPMSAPDWQPETAVKMAEANFLGALRVLGHVVPHWVRRGSGHVVLIGSLVGFRGLPGVIGYGASKAAVNHLAENMLTDLRGTGVEVQLANPGFIRTRLTDKNDFNMPQIQQPEEAAADVLRLIDGHGWVRNFPRPFAWVFTLGRFLPFRLFSRLISSG